MTRQQFAIRVLSKLRVYDQGTVSGADQLNVDDTYDGVYEILKDDGIVTWAKTDDIPDKHVLSLVDIVASQLKADYNQPESQIDQLPVLKHPGVATIRRQLARPYERDTTPIEYF